MTDEAAAISADDLAAVEKVAGWEATAAQRELMAPRMGKLRETLKAIRHSTLTDGAPSFHFDPLLRDTALPTGKSACKPSRAGKTPRTAPGGDALAFLSVLELHYLLRARKISATELTRFYLDRLKKFGPRLLCVVSLCEERALAEAAQADREIAAGKWRGPLHGIPYGLKDLFAARETFTTFGAEPYAEQRWDFDCTVAARLKEAGAILVAKLSMGELAMGDVWFGGTTRNPWKPETGSSGSSAGSASAVAAGLVGFAIGTETLGSIISPCNVCGTTGLRPTFGRVPRTGAMPLSWTMDKIGSLCRSVEDCALIFAAIHGADGQDTSCWSQVPFRWNGSADIKGLRVGVDMASLNSMEEGGENAERGKTLQPIFREALAELAHLGVTPIPVTLPAKNPAFDGLSWLTIQSEGAASFAKLRAEGGFEKLKQQDDWNWPNAFRIGATIPASDYIQAQRVRVHLQRAVAAALKEVDVLITFPWFGPSLTYFNLTGQPTVITRCGKTGEGLPVQLEFSANLCQEEKALCLAFAFERATAWNRHWPDTEKLPETPPEMAKLDK